jgi:serine/threonine protein kinase
VHARYEVVAVKTIPTNALPASSSLARFDLEARAAARLRHPNIVQIYDVGNHAGGLRVSERHAT